MTSPTPEERAREIVEAIRAQNWKNGGALVMDIDEAEALVALALTQVEKETIERVRRLERAAGSVACWFAMVQAERELAGEPPFADSDVILHFMGCGASHQVTAGDLRSLSPAREDER